MIEICEINGDENKTWSEKITELFPPSATKLWSEKLLDWGFEAILDNPAKKTSAYRFMGQKYNPKLNWHGVSTYAPDQILKKGIFEVHISLQGLLCPPNMAGGISPKIIEAMGVKYICVWKNDNEKLFETFYGTPVPEEIMAILKRGL